MATLEQRFKDFSDKISAKLNALKTELGEISPWKGLSPNTGNSLSEDLEGKLFYKEPTAEEMKTGLESIADTNFLSDDEQQTIENLAEGLSELDNIREPITIDNRFFFFEKGITSGDENTGSEIEINDLALCGVFFDPGINRWMKGDLKCIDNTGDLTTGIGTKWQKQPGAYPID